MEKTSMGHKILHFPLTKIIIGILVCVVAVSAAQLLLGQLLDQATLDRDIKALISGLFVGVLTVVAYTLLFRTYEKRRVTEFSTAGLSRNLTLGIGLGALLQSLTILVIYLKGGYAVVAVNSLLFLLPPLTMAFTSAIFEETLLRGIIFRITEEKLGSTIALVISAALFGALHLANPHSSVAAAVGLAIQAGLLLGAAYMYARNLWFPIAIHFAWNFTQSAIFGANVSGNAISKTLITSQIEGDEWYTGGAFGPEGSIQATGFCFIATLVLLRLSRKEGKFVKPYWKTSH